MVDKEISDTIENLKASGVSKEEIKDMLRDIGFDESAINEAFGSASAGKEKEKDSEDVEVKEETSETNDSAEDAKSHAHSAKLASSLAMNVAQTASESVDRHAETVKRFEKKIDDFSDSLDSLPTRSHFDGLSEKSEDTARRLDDIDTKIDVLTKLMQKLLDNQRDILMKLK